VTDSSTRVTSPPRVEGEESKLDAVKKLKLNDIRKALPPDVFVKSLSKSLFYLAFDAAICLSALYAMHTVVNTSYWESVPLVAKALCWLVYWNVVGFFMWCLFVVGHDCGHGTFSDYEWLNDVIGHITHGALLVPYYPWQLTHRRHHMYHNHVTKDYSHPWYTESNVTDANLYLFFRHHKDLMATMPLFGWAFYLMGSPDGNHFIPFPSQRMWKESPFSEYVKCIVSTIVACVYAYCIFVFACNSDVETYMFYYGVPLLVYGWWLVCVTYLQHHCPSTVVYDNDSWNFFTAAFETVDRTFGYGLDDLSHNITDGHVVHHLFFTKIPHYHLKRATLALQTYLYENNASHLYKHEETFDFPLRVHQYFREFGFDATLYVKDENKRSNN
jgi:omega-3 fatty acid desaturase (delta-15 desaturase)